MRLCLCHAPPFACPPALHPYTCANTLGRRVTTTSPLNDAISTRLIQVPPLRFIPPSAQELISIRQVHTRPFIIYRTPVVPPPPPAPTPARLCPLCAPAPCTPRALPLCPCASLRSAMHASPSPPLLFPSCLVPCLRPSSYRRLPHAPVPHGKHLCTISCCTSPSPLPLMAGAKPCLLPRCTLHTNLPALTPAPPFNMTARHTYPLAAATTRSPSPAATLEYALPSAAAYTAQAPPQRPPPVIAHTNPASCRVPPRPSPLV